MMPFLFLLLVRAHCRVAAYASAFPSITTFAGFVSRDPLLFLVFALGLCFVLALKTLTYIGIPLRASIRIRVWGLGLEGLETLKLEASTQPNLEARNPRQHPLRSQHVSGIHSCCCQQSSISKHLKHKHQNLNPATTRLSLHILKYVNP